MNSSDDSLEPVDSVGHSALDLLHKAADAADHNTRQALESAQRLAQQLKAARDHVAQLEHDLDAHRDRAERAEGWLNKIQGEVEEQFTRDGRRR
jgi:predicted  nucleic acid-binding Zn-ribbon protein